MEKWEYWVAQVAVVEFEELQPFLTERGDEGWQLVSVTLKVLPETHLAETNYQFDQYTMFFKRPK